MAIDLNILAISYGRNLFEADNIERKRMELCAGEVSSYHMVVFTKQSDGLMVTQADNGLTLHPTNSKTRFHMIADAVRIGASLLKHREGQWVITTQDPFESGLVGYTLARRYAAKLNIQEHGDFFSTNAWRKESMLNQIRFLMGKWLLRRADTVRVVSKRMEVTMKRIGVSADRILRLAVRTEDNAGEHAAVDLHAEYPDASVIILSMARFVPQKNISLLITAFYEVYTHDDKALLILIGTGPEEQKLRHQVAQYGLAHAVLFKPWTDTPQTYMQSADIYALSSNYEGWARVLVEAMLAGTPMVTTDVGCAGEVVRDGVHGFVVPVGDAGAFAEKLQIFVQDPGFRACFSSVAQKDVASVHVTSERYVQDWATVLEQTAGA